jgi:hypothetical protein
MAIANSYFNSSPITDSDIFVGTKYATNRTVNYTAQSIADYLNVNARISISGQLTFKFTILPNVAKTIAFEDGGGDGRLFSSIDKLIVSILDASGSNITVFLDYLIDSEILLAEQNQPNSFGHYKITNYVVTANPNFYELSLEYIGGNGNIYKDIYYDMTPWASSGGVGTTPNLQQVTDQGNETTNGIIINSENLPGQSFKVTNPIGSTSELYSDGLSFVAQSGTTSALANGALTLGDFNLDPANPLNLNVVNDTTNYGVGFYLNSSPILQDISFIFHPDYFIPQPPSSAPSIFYIPYKLDGTYTLATLDDIPSGGGTVTSVGLTMPSAFTVTNSPITSSGDIAVTGAGTVSQYVRGDGSLANFPASSGGGASLSFYLNGSVSQGTFGGVAFREMDRTPILGAGTDFTINANGYIQSFITDAGVPNLLEIPAGNWNFETYFSASSGGGSPSFYIELYKWDGVTLSLIASSSANPEGITNGTVTDLYVSALAVPQTTLLATDRLAVRIWVNNSGRTITLHTEDNNLCQVITTFSTGLTALNGLTAQVQNFATGTSGTDFAISSTTSTHTFNLPTASATNRGALSSTDWSTFNNKQNNLKTFNTTQGIYYFEEFMGAINNTIVSAYNSVVSLLTGNGSITMNNVATSNRTNQQGVITHSTGTASTNYAGYNYGVNSLYRGTGAITLETYIIIPTLSTSGERFVTVFGEQSGSNFMSPANCISIVYDEGGVFLASGVASNNWRCFTRAGSTITRTDTTVPVVANQWYKLRINISADGLTITFFIGNVLVATHNTNVPLISTQLTVASYIMKSVGTTARTMQTDYFMYEEIFTNPR